MATARRLRLRLSPCPSLLRQSQKGLKTPQKMQSCKKLHLLTHLLFLRTRLLHRQMRPQHLQMSLLLSAMGQLLLLLLLQLLHQP